MPAAFLPVGIPESERPKPSQVPQGAYTSNPTGDHGDLANFTRTRPFIKCMDCGTDLAPSAAAVCPVCERMKHSQVSRVPYGPQPPDGEYQDK